MNECIFIVISAICLTYAREYMSSGSSSKESPSKFYRNRLETVAHRLPSLEDILGMAHGLVIHDNTVQDTAGINTWVTNKRVVKRTLIGSFVRRVSLWQRRETFVSLFRRWPHRAPDGSPPPCFNWPQRQRWYTCSICNCCSPSLLLGVRGWLEHVGLQSIYTSIHPSDHQMRVYSICEGSVRMHPDDLM